MTEPHITKGVVKVGIPSWKEIQRDLEALEEELAEPQQQESDTDQDNGQ